MPTQFFHNFASKYFGNHMSRQIKELYASTAILIFAEAALAIFEPIYFITIGFTLRQILLFYVGVYMLYFIFLPLGGKFARSHGYEHGILYSSPFLILYYLSLFAIPYNKIFIAIALTAFVIHKCLYWPAYHADMARFGSPAERGREISGFIILLSSVAVIAPAIGGFIIASFGFRILFVIAAALILLSNIPLLLTPEKFTPVQFSYKQAWKELFSREHSFHNLARLGYGEQILVAVVWPIFIFTIIPSFRDLGLVTSMTILITAIAVLYVGRITDLSNRISLMKTGIIFTALSWLVRLTTGGPFGVLGINVFYGIAREIFGIPFTASVYDEAKSSSVMRTLIHEEMALAASKTAACLLAIGLVALFPPGWQAIFVAGFAFTLFYLFACKKK